MSEQLQNASGGAKNFPTGRAGSSDEGAKIQFSGQYNAKDLRKSRFSPSDGDQHVLTESMFQRHP